MKGPEKSTSSLGHGSLVIHTQGNFGGPKVNSKYNVKNWFFYKQMATWIKTIYLILF